MTESSDCFLHRDGERLSRVEYAYRKIKNGIKKNNYPAGFQILEPDLARLLGISRTPVREALIRLAADNLIQLVPRKGMRVLPIRQQDVSELIQAITSVQVGAAKIICDREAGCDFQNLERKIQQLHKADANEDKSEWIELDEAFQADFISLAGNSRIERIFNDLLAQLHRAKIAAFTPQQSGSEFIAANSELLLALKERRNDVAVSAIHRYRDAFIALFDLSKNNDEMMF